MRSGKVLFEEKCDRVRGLETVKGKIVTAGKTVTFWEDDSPVSVWTEFAQVNSAKFSEDLDMLFLACSDGGLWVIVMKGVRV